MENKVMSKWGVELKGIFKDNSSDTLTIVLPGVAYLIDRSYLDYSRSLASELGYDVLTMEYGFQINRTEFSIEKEFHLMAKETIEAIQKSITKEYSKIVIIGKSIGTCVQVMLNGMFKGKDVKNIYISPIDKTAKHGVCENSLVITGTKDPLLNKESLEKIENVKGVKLVNIDDANHALDIEGNVLESIKVLFDVIEMEREFLLN
ncbi:MAG: alpha/beta hydrolase [Clostridium sp.]|uniref:alpha/beta hydrolase n=1 Tax=Clostridium sp. TaxID=1506 RepID=UPI003EE42A08